jgi:hypothetical protein
VLQQELGVRAQPVDRRRARRRTGFVDIQEALEARARAASADVEQRKLDRCESARVGIDVGGVLIDPGLESRTSVDRLEPRCLPAGHRGERRRTGFARHVFAWASFAEPDASGLVLRDDDHVLRAHASRGCVLEPRAERDREASGL